MACELIPVRPLRTIPVTHPLNKRLKDIDYNFDIVGAQTGSGAGDGQAAIMKFALVTNAADQTTDLDRDDDVVLDTIQYDNLPTSLTVSENAITLGSGTFIIIANIGVWTMSSTYKFGVQHIRWHDGSGFVGSRGALTWWDHTVSLANQDWQGNPNAMYLCNGNKTLTLRFEDARDSSNTQITSAITSVGGLSVTVDILQVA